MLGAIFGAHSWWKARPMLRAQATVTENMSAFAPEGGVRYSPRLRFRTGDGTLVEVIAGDGGDEPEFAPGAVVPVMYRAGQPQKAVIATVWRVYRTGIVLAVVGTLVFDAGLILLIVVKRRAGSTPA